MVSVGGFCGFKTEILCPQLLQLLRTKSLTPTPKALPIKRKPLCKPQFSCNCPFSWPVDYPLSPYRNARSRMYMYNIHIYIYISLSLSLSLSASPSLPYFLSAYLPSLLVKPLNQTPICPNPKPHKLNTNSSFRFIFHDVHINICVCVYT